MTSVGPIWVAAVVDVLVFEEVRQNVQTGEELLQGVLIDFSPPIGIR